MDLMTEKEFNVFSLITAVLVFTSVLVGFSANNEVKPTDNAAKPKTVVESSDIATGIYTEALMRQGEYEAWELARQDASRRDIILGCNDTNGKTYRNCVQFWTKIADDQFIFEALRVISRGTVRIVFSGYDGWKLFEVGNSGAVFIPMSATVEDIKKHLRSRG